MSTSNKAHRPQLPVRKPLEDDNNVLVRFTTREVREENSYVILATEPDLYHVMTAWLTNKRHKFVEVKGGYRMQDEPDNFIEEDAVLVRRDVAVLIWQQGWIDTQESVLHLYRRDNIGRYRAELVFLNDTSREDVDLGHLIQTTKEKALANPDGYTYKIETDSYYICYKPPLNEKD